MLSSTQDRAAFRPCRRSPEIRVESVGWLAGADKELAMRKSRIEDDNKIKPEILCFKRRPRRTPIEQNEIHVHLVLVPCSA